MLIGKVPHVQTPLASNIIGSILFGFKFLPLGCISPRLSRLAPLARSTSTFCFMFEETDTAESPTFEQNSQNSAQHNNRRFLLPAAFVPVARRRGKYLPSSLFHKSAKRLPKFVRTVAVVANLPKGLRIFRCIQRAAQTTITQGVARSKDL